MPTPLSKGVYVKPRRAWGLDSAAGASVVQSAVAAQFNYASLYNDSNPAVDLAVYGISAWQSSGATTVEGKSLLGQLPGATLVSAGNPLISGGPTPPGSFYKLQSATVFGTTIFEFGGNGQWFFNLDDSPMLILPPNFSFLLKVAVVNLNSAFSLIWGIN